MDRETKAGPAFTVKADQDQGVVETIFSVFGNVDNGGDIVHPGAFTKTFAERGLEVRVLDQHMTDSVSRALGKPLELREVGRDELPADLLERFPEATGGALAKVQFLMSTPEGKGAFERIKEGVINQWSFAFLPLDADFSEVTMDGEPMTVRNLRTLKLFEISPVLFGMNEATTTTSAKEDEAGEKGGADEEKATNLSQHVANVRDAVEAQFNPSDGPWEWWAREVFDEYVIVCFSGEAGTEYYQVPYLVSGEEGNITFAPRSDWVRGIFEFVPISTQKADDAPSPDAEAAEIEQEDGKGAGPDDEPPTSNDDILMEIQKEIIEADLLEVRAYGSQGKDR